VRAHQSWTPRVRRLAVAGAALIVVATVAGSTATAGSGSAPATAAPDAGEGCSEEDNIPELKMANSVPPASLSPLFGQASGSGYNSIVSVYGELMQFDPLSGETVPSLAESLESNDDLTEWTLTLRPGITFGSGNPYDTAAVKWNFDYIANPDNASASLGQAGRIEQIEIVDDLTMTFTLTEPYGDFPVMLGAPIGSIVDPAVYEEVGEEGLNGANAPGAGAGAYEFESWDRAVSVVVTRKDDYWGPRPCVERFEEIFFSDNRTRSDAFVNGEVDAIYLRGPIPHGLIREADPPDTDSFTQVVNGGSVMVINAGAQGVDRPGADIRVRRAIALALDPTVINDRLLDGNGRPSKAFLDAESAFYSDGIVEVPYDPDQARALLEEAMADGYDGSLYFPTSNTPDAVDQALIIQAQLEAVGFTVERDSTFDGAGISQLLVSTNEYDIVTTALSAFDSDILGELNKRVFPFSGFSSPEFDAAKAALAGASDTESRTAALAQVSQVWADQAPWVTLDHHEVSLYWRNDITGWGFSKAGIIVIDAVRPAA
jgi:peptide/nickel transport system substrate-binding protein